MVRIYTFRGKTIDDMQKMSMDDFSKMLKARPRRALKRMSSSYKELIAKADAVKKSGSGKVIKTHTREAVILPSWYGMKFAIYDGHKFQELMITPEMVGHRIGEYVYTVKRVVHSAPGIRATRGSKFLAVK